MNRRNGHAFSGAVVFLLLLLFALFGVMLALLGAQAYRNTVEDGERHGEHRILQTFMLNAVQADDARNAVVLERAGDMDVLRFDYDYDGEGYVKRIYCYEGALRELLTEADGGFDPGDGEIICAAQALTLSRTNNLITMVIADQNGRTHTAQIALRCAG